MLAIHLFVSHAECTDSVFIYVMEEVFVKLECFLCVDLNSLHKLVRITLKVP